MAQQPLDHQALFNARLIARSLTTVATPPAHQQLLNDWADTIRSGAIRARTEQQIRGSFTQKFFVELLGYTAFGSATHFTMGDENFVGKGRADVVLGHFGPNGDQVIAPVELKGADTPNLDVTMPGRYKSPVQQAWEYAMDTPNCKFLLVSNMLEIRLYAVGHTRRVYERFDLVEVADHPHQYQRLMLLLGADNLLGGRTAALLAESGQIEKQITRELYADYKRWRIQLITALAQANDLPPGDLITPAQKLLDRILFVAFAQQRGLLPPNTLKSVHNDSGWAELPKYDNYKSLFKAIDKGLPSRGIPPYNGGLFAPDDLLDSITVPNSACDVFLEFGKYDFGGEVSVNVLGHIFEQSISDLEELKALADTGAFTLEALAAQVNATASSTSVSGARKVHGIVYTPEFITTFIVDQTLEKTINSRRIHCLSSYQINSETTTLEWRKPTAAEKLYAKTALKQPERVVELAFWRAWLADLTTLKVCDPACGSGAFLVAAFDCLLAEYNNVNEQIATISGSMEVFNADKEILNSNLFGVDLNAESIEITKLSLWLKTAKHGKPLESLEANLQVGNSLISSADDGFEGQSYDPKAFDWTAAFPQVVAQGGFDVIIGNPPYVRQELISPVKPYLEKRYACYDGTVDLYAYFFELGIRLLRNGNNGGRIGYVSSGTFFKTGSGAKLRAYLLDNAQIETVIDFGDLQVFEGVTTYPVIITLRRSGAPDPAQNIRFLKLSTELPVKLIDTFEESAAVMPQSQLGMAGWQLEDSKTSALSYKLLTENKTIREVYGSPLRGILTGLNEAFVLSRTERDDIVKKIPESAQFFKPYLEGKELKKWRIESDANWLLLIKRGQTRALMQRTDAVPESEAWAWFKEQFKELATWLEKYEVAAKKRTDMGEFWWELRACTYYDVLENAKVAWGRFQPEPLYSFDPHGLIGNDNVYCIKNSGYFEAGLLNSKVIWFVTKQICPPVRGGFYPVRSSFAEKFPIPTASEADKSLIATLAQSAQTAAEARRDEIARFGRAALRDLVPGGLSNLTAKGGAKLPAAWYDGVPEFKDFTLELKKRFKRELNLQERNDWDAAVTQARERVAALTQQIIQAEREIDSIVYRLFELTKEEITLIEQN